MPNYLKPVKGRWVVDTNPTTQHGQLDIKGRLIVVNGPASSNPKAAVVFKGRVVPGNTVTLRSLVGTSYSYTAPITITSSTPTQADGKTILLQNQVIGSTTGATPAISLTSVENTKTVTLRSCVVRGFGLSAGASGIILYNGGSYGNIDMEDCIIFSDMPTINGQTPGRVIAGNWGNVRIVNCTFISTAGMSIDGGGVAGRCNVEIRRLVVTNIDGRIRDTSQTDGWKHSNTWGAYNSTDGFIPAQLLQLTNFNAPSSFIVEDIDNVNYAHQSRYEDLFSLNNATGTSSVPLLFQQVLNVGHYVYDWAWNPTTNTGFYGNNVPDQGSSSANSAIGRYSDARGLVDSGGGGLISDGDNGSNTPLQQYAVYNQFTQIATANYGVAINGGLNHKIQNSTILRSGYVYGLAGSIKIPQVNTPIQVTYGPNPSTPPVGRWDGHQILNNVTGYRNYSPLDSAWHEQLLFFTTSTRVTSTGNTQKNGVTVADEQAAIDAHRLRWQQAGKTIVRLT